MRKLEKVLPTLALILPLLPWVLSIVLATLGAGGNWGFWILALIVFVVSAVICGIGGMILAVLTLRNRWGLKRGMAAAILAGFELLIACAFLSRFLWHL